MRAEDEVRVERRKTRDDFAALFLRLDGCRHGRWVTQCSGLCRLQQRAGFGYGTSSLLRSKAEPERFGRCAKAGQCTTGGLGVGWACFSSCEPQESKG